MEKSWYSHTGRLNIAKMLILSKLIYRLNAVLFKIQHKGLFLRQR